MRVEELERDRRIASQQSLIHESETAGIDICRIELHAGQNPVRFVQLTTSLQGKGLRSQQVRMTRPGAEPFLDQRGNEAKFARGEGQFQGFKASAEILWV